MQGINKGKTISRQSKKRAIRQEVLLVTPDTESSLGSSKKHRPWSRFLGRPLPALPPPLVTDSLLSDYLLSLDHTPGRVSLKVSCLLVLPCHQGSTK